MAEHPVAPKPPSKAPEAVDNRSDVARIIEDMRCSDWEERLRVQQRLIAEGKTLVRAPLLARTPQAEIAGSAPSLAGFPLERLMESEKVQPFQAATPEIFPARHEVKAGFIAVAKPALLGGYVGLAIGFGIGLVIGFVAHDRWTTGLLAGAETAVAALPKADFGPTRPDADARLAEETSPIIRAMGDSPITRLPKPVMAGRMKTEATQDAVSFAGGNALTSPVVAVSVSQSFDSAQISETLRRTKIPASDTPPNPVSLPVLMVPEARFALDEDILSTFPAPKPVEVLAAIWGDGSLSEYRDSAGALILPEPEGSIRPNVHVPPLLPPSADDAISAISQGVPVVSGDRYQIHIHMAAKQSDTAVRAELRNLGLVNARSVFSDLGTTRTTVTYYNSGDAEVAAALASLYKGTVIDMTGFVPAPAAHTLDLYLKAD